MDPAHALRGAGLFAMALEAGSLGHAKQALQECKLS